MAALTLLDPSQSTAELLDPASGSPPSGSSVGLHKIPAPACAGLDALQIPSNWPSNQEDLPGGQHTSTVPVCCQTAAYHITVSSDTFNTSGPGSLGQP